jgi:hypothetical protein
MPSQPEAATTANTPRAGPVFISGRKIASDAGVLRLARGRQSLVVQVAPPTVTVIRAPGGGPLR